MKKILEEEKIYKNEIWKNVFNSKYEISNYGRVRKLYKYSCRYLKTFRKGSIQIIKLTMGKSRKDYNIARLVIHLFNRPLKKDEVIYHKNGIIADNRLSNLEVLTRKEAGKRTGWQSNRKGIVMLDNKGVISKVFKGTRDAADKLFISRQTVSDYCNEKVKNPMYKLYWADNLIERSCEANENKIL